MSSWRAVRSFCSFLALILFIHPEAFGQESAANQSNDEVSFKVTGGIQPRFSYGLEKQPEGDVDRLGFGLRRGRIDVVVSMGNKLGINYDMDFSRGNLSTVDLVALYQSSAHVRFRLGYFGHAQPRAYAITSSNRLDGIERAAVAERWARSTIGASGRDFGADLTYDMPATRLIFGVHNGDGSFSTGNYRQGVARLSEGANRDIKSLAYSAYMNHQLPFLSGLEIGGFAGYNGSRNDNTSAGASEMGRSYVSWSSHLYWGADPGSQPVRLKLELIGLHFEETALTIPVDEEDVVSYAVTGAMRILDAGELYARFEQQRAGGEVFNEFIDTGLTYSWSARKGQPFHKQRLTLSYQSGRSDISGTTAHHLVVLQTQSLF